MQDPAERPTSAALLEHEFVAQAGLPLGLTGQIAVHAAKRAPLNIGDRQQLLLQQTLPKWNFGTHQGEL